ncbi:MAG: hypothetical protein IT270_11995 [Saprospiraceae bacterium]|nr:hypothetical protein [Saprospiraceae bacterium]
MKHFPFFALFLLVFCHASHAQLITFNGQGGLLIPPGAPAQTVGITQSPCNVSGIGILGGCVSIDNVQINLQHTFVGDIAIMLIGPGGQVLDLSSGNGGGGDNYFNTIFTDNAADFITSSAPPYAGTFRPEGRATTLVPPFTNAPPLGTFTFANTFNGTNADGVWLLHVNDYVAVDVGEIISWSITFNVGGTPPVANAGADVFICPGQSTTLTATGGGTYLWSNGATTASTSVAPPGTQTYTVTVTIPNCGTDTDEVTVFVEPGTPPGLTLSAPGICPNGSVTINVTEPAMAWLWSNGATTPSITVTQPGTYGVTITSPIGCILSNQIDVPEAALPTVESLLVGNPDVCADDCADIEVQLMGLAPFEFTWQFQQNGNPVGGSQQVNTSSNTAMFQACPPGGMGNIQVVICTVNDANCPN